MRKLGQPQDLPSAAVNAALAACEKVGVTGDMRRAGRGELLRQGHALKAEGEMLQLLGWHLNDFKVIFCVRIQLPKPGLVVAELLGLLRRASASVHGN